MKDRIKSLLNRLKNKSKETGVGFQQLLLLLCQEEFLRRLSKSSYNENYVLKGGLYIYLLSDFKSRVTIDMDFLIRNQTNAKAKVVEQVTEILKISTENEFITFEIKKIEDITMENIYPGISIQMVGKIGNTKTPVNIDFGIGDIIVPEPELRILRPQLDEFQSVDVITYSLESSVAEKIDAILQRFELSSRMKDFYDLWYISVNFDFDGMILKEAVKSTLVNRGTLIEKDSLIRIKMLSENQVIESRWKSYSKKNMLELEIVECINMLEKLLRPVFQSILNDDEFNEKWVSSELNWKLL